MSDTKKPVSEAEFAESTIQQIKLTLPQPAGMNTINRGSPVKDEILYYIADQAYTRFSALIDVWTKDKSIETSVLFAKAISRFIQSYVRPKKNWNELTHDEIDALLVNPLQKFKELQVGNFGLPPKTAAPSTAGPSYAATASVAPKTYENDAFDKTLINYQDIERRYHDERSGTFKFRQDPERGSQIAMLGSVIKLLSNAKDLQQEDKASILRHVLRTLQSKLNKTSSLGKIVEEINIALLDKKISPTDKTQQQHDVETFRAAVQPGGLLATLLQDKTCGKLMQGMKNTASSGESSGAPEHKNLPRPKS